MTDHDWVTFVNVLPDGTEWEMEIREDLLEELLSVGDGIHKGVYDGDADDG